MNAQVAPIKNAETNGNKLIVKFEVTSDFVESRGGVGKNGKPYEIHSQRVWAYLNGKFPKEMQVNHDDARNAFPEGLYEADLRPALDIGDFGKMVIDGRRLALVPVKA